MMLTAIALFMFLSSLAVYHIPFMEFNSDEKVDNSDYFIHVVTKALYVLWTMTAGVWCLFKGYVFVS